MRGADRLPAAETRASRPGFAWVAVGDILPALCEVMMNPRLTTFLELFLKSPFYRPVQVVLTEAEAYFARTLPGFQIDLPPPQLIAGAPDSNGLASWVP